MNTEAKSTSNKSLWLALGFGAVALVILLSLGTWQVQRLAWKENLIKTVETRLANEPVNIMTVLPKDGVFEEVEYTPVTVSGSYVPGEAFFEFTTYKGNSGWHLFHLLETTAEDTLSARYTVVNRGFIPYDQRENWQAVAPLPQGEVTITGLFRVGQMAKPGFLVPDNDLSERSFYWRSLEGMAQAAGVAADDVAPWYVDRGIPGQGQAVEDFPIPGNTIIKFSNNHLQYAVTWYGLALTLVGVLGYWVFVRRRGQ